MSETTCIHGLRVDPDPEHCIKCEREAIRREAPWRSPAEVEAEQIAALDLAIRQTMGESLADPESAGVPTWWSETLGRHVTIPQDEPDYGGAFDGFTVSSDADPGL